MLTETPATRDRESEVRERGRIWGVLRWWLILFLPLAAVFFFVVTPWFFTYVLTADRYHFRDPNDGKTPQDFGMAYRPVDFE